MISTIKNTLPCLALLLTLACNKIPDSIETGRIAATEPAYSNLVIPNNIAPLNFSITEKGTSFFVQIRGNKGKQIVIKSSDGNVVIPQRRWKKLLSENKNDSVYIDIHIKENSGKWVNYKTFKYLVSADCIDSYIVYRNIGPANVLWNDMSIEQRNLENFSVLKIADNMHTSRNCMNCHSFNSKKPDQMVFHMRANPAGTIIKKGDKLQFFNTATDSTMSAGVYPAWHPSGKYIAFSVNRIHQYFFSQTGKYEIVEDKVSDIVLLDIDKNMITTCPPLSTGLRENMPAWSSDGKYLYYILGNKYNSDNYRENRYDLMRIPFDESECRWGEPDTVLIASRLGKSISFPALSPDGKWLLFCMADYGYFTVYNPESDIYLMNLETREYKKLTCNSTFVESYPSWSGNGKWIMFVSKRNDDIFSRPWFCHFNNGEVSEPFILPQANPLFYNSYLRNFNRPEFVTDKVNITPGEIYKLAQEKPLKSRFDPEVRIDALSGATRIIKSDSSLKFKE